MVYRLKVDFAGMLLGGAGRTVVFTASALGAAVVAHLAAAFASANAMLCLGAPLLAVGLAGAASPLRRA